MEHDSTGGPPSWHSSGPPPAAQPPSQARCKTFEVLLEGDDLVVLG